MFSECCDFAVTIVTEQISEHVHVETYLDFKLVMYLDAFSVKL
jgi:hypothetical protein